MDDISKIGPNLSKIKKEKHFAVPKGYFERFPARMSDKIHAEQEMGFYKKHVLTLKPYFAIAAIFLGLVIVGKISYELLNPGSTGTDLESNEIVALIEDDIYYYSDEIILDVISMKENISTNESMESHDEDLTNDVIDYLIDENIDLYDIIEAL